MPREKGTPRPPKPEGVESNSREKASNKSSRREREEALQALFHSLPPDTDLTTLMFQLMGQFKNALSGDPAPADNPLYPAADRHAAIVCAAAIEHGLRKTIAMHLDDGADLAAVFESYPSAPLSSFADRTVMARALGIISEAEAADLNGIRRIRNIFAHSVHQVSFATPEVAHLAGELKTLDGPDWELLSQMHKPPRERYIVTCAIRYVALNQYDFSRPSRYQNDLARALATLPRTQPQQSPPSDDQRGSWTRIGRHAPPTSGE
jgi:hypothetical protein